MVSIILYFSSHILCLSNKLANPSFAHSSLIEVLQISMLNFWPRFISNPNPKGFLSFNFLQS